MNSQEKRSLMLSMVEQWEQSGMSQTAFAHSQRVTLVKLRYWIKKHRQTQQAGGFIQLSGLSSCDAISIRYPNGVELSLPAHAFVEIKLHTKNVTRLSNNFLRKTTKLFKSFLIFVLNL